MTKKEYVEKAVSRIKGKTERREVEEELGAHIDELTELWRNRGLDESDAEEKAVEEMGSPDSVAEGLVKLHSTFRYVVSKTFSVLLTICWAGFAAVMIVFARFTLVAYYFSLGAFQAQMAVELFFLLFGSLTLLFAKRKNDPFLCGAAALAASAYAGIPVAMVVNDLYESVMAFGNLSAFSEPLPTSPAVLILAAVVSGHYGDLTEELLSTVRAAPSVSLLSGIIYSLWFCSALIIFISTIRQRGRHCGRKAVRFGKYAARCISVIGVLILCASLPPAINAGIARIGADEPVYYDGWYLVQCDNREDDVYVPVNLWNMQEDAYYIEIDRDFGPFYLDWRNGEDLESSSSETIRWTEASVDGLFDIYAEVAEWELETENRYLYAVPADEGRIFPEYAEWFDLTDQKPIFLPIGTEASERYSLIRIDALGK